MHNPHLTFKCLVSFGVIYSCYYNYGAKELVIYISVRERGREGERERDGEEAMLPQGGAEQGSLDLNGGWHPCLLHPEAWRGQMGKPPQKSWSVSLLSLALSLLWKHMFIILSVKFCFDVGSDFCATVSVWFDHFLKSHHLFTKMIKRVDDCNAQAWHVSRQVHWLLQD